MKMRVKLQRGHQIIIGKNNIIVAALINFDLRYLTLNYIINIFFNIQFLLEHFSLSINHTYYYSSNIYVVV